MVYSVWYPIIRLSGPFDTDRGPPGSSLDTSREKMIHLTRFDLFHNINDEKSRTDKGRE